MGTNLRLSTKYSVTLLTLAIPLCILIPGQAAGQSEPTIAGCPFFPADNVWNTPIDHLPVDPNSASYISTMGASGRVHPDFGSGLWDGGPIGIPFNIVPGTQPRVPVSFDYADESDPGPYPIPSDAAIEGGSQSEGDRHVLVVDQGNCILYEVFSAYPQQGGSWTAGSGAVFDLRSHGLRPSGWTSADAAGLPILAGLVRYDEVASGEIRHALRFTAPQTRRAFVWPARHYASSLTASNYPPMGQRFRLKANVDITGFSPEVQVILRALKKYGMILADNGSAWYLSGAPDPRWNNDHLVSELRSIPGADFEAVDGTALMISPDSGQALQPLPPGSAFMDVLPAYWAHSHIMALYDSGITGGCSVYPPLFCPEESITRGQMAVFIETSLGHSPAACTGLYADVPTNHPFCGFIENLAGGGITAGCSAADFCPDEPVTRGQMAVFIETALGNLPHPCPGQFTDVSSNHPFCGFIERLAADGITSGCGSGNFCPDAPITRGQMAVFLVAAPAPLNP
jgi:hypothetical protein